MDIIRVHHLAFGICAFFGFMSAAIGNPVVGIVALIAGLVGVAFMVIDNLDKPDDPPPASKEQSGLFQLNGGDFRAVARSLCRDPLDVRRRLRTVTYDDIGREAKGRFPQRYEALKDEDAGIEYAKTELTDGERDLLERSNLVRVKKQTDLHALDFHVIRPDKRPTAEHSEDSFDVDPLGILGGNGDN